MPGTRCKTCEHPQREAIEAELIRGASERDIAKRYGLNHVALNRHKLKHLGPKLRAAFKRDEENTASLADEILWNANAARSEYEQARESGVRLSALSAHMNAMNGRAKWVERIADKHEVAVAGAVAMPEHPEDMADFLEAAARAVRSGGK